MILSTPEHAALIVADIAVKGFLLLAFATAIALLLHKRAAATRHLTWLMAFAGLLLLPVLSLLSPRWTLFIPPPAAAVLARPAPFFITDHPAPPQHVSPIEPTAIPITQPAQPATPTPPIPAARHVIPLPQLLVIIAATGTAIILGRLAFGLLIVSRLRRRARLLNDESWNSLQADLAQSIGLARPALLLECATSTMPMASGWLRPAVLLPAESRHWSPEKRRMVLLHELAHLRRRDCLTNVLARTAFALHWFNPLAWLALRRLIAERELACDDVVLLAGSLPSRYAEYLLDVARSTRAKTLTTLAAIPMATGTRFERRLLAILDAARPRRAATRRAVALGLAITALLAFPLAALRLAAQPAKPEITYTPITADTRPTSDITGTLRDESGHPLANLKILALHGAESTDQRQTTQTNSAGQFIFKHLQPGTWLFSADDPHYAWDWDHERGLTLPVLPENLPLPITLYTPRTLHGTITNDAGQPVPNTRVILVNQTLPGHTHPVAGHIDVDFLTATTDAAGHFTLDRLRPGTAQFILEHPDYANTFATATIDGSQPAFTIHKGLTLHGQVTHNGQPVPGIGLSAGRNEGHRPIVNWHGKTDANGRFEIPRIPPKQLPDCQCPSADVSVRDDAWYSDNYEVYQSADEQLSDLMIDAKPAVGEKHPDPISIDIGKPADPKTPALPPGQGATLTVHVPGTTGAYPNVFVTSLAPVDIPLQVDQKIHEQTAVVKDLPPGPYIVSLFGGIYTPGRPPKSIELAPGQALDVTLEPGPAQIHGTITSGGKPVAGGTISWFRDPRIPHAVFQGGADIHPDGTYTITGLSEGDYRLTYEAPNSMTTTFIAHARPGAAPFDIHLPTSHIEGRLIGRTPTPGRPNPLGNIVLAPREISAEKKEDQMTFVETDPNGKFAFDHLPPGEYRITGYGLTTTLTVERDDSIVSVSLRPPEKTGEIAGTLKGHLPTSPDDWNSIQIAAIPHDQHGYNFNIWTHTTTANPNTGAYRIRDLPPGTYGVYITNAGFEKRIPTILIPSIEVREGLSRDLPIDIPEGRVVTVDVPAGSMHTFKSWHLRLPSGDWLDQMSLSWAVKLPLGQYTAEADYGPRGLTTYQFTVQPGDGTQKITLPAPATN